MIDALIIDPALKALLFPLRPEELASLESQILAEGCREALIAWRTDDGAVLVDGHNRHAICTKHGLPYRVDVRDFASREAVESWIDDNQLGRRNLTPDAFALVLGRRYNRTKRQGARNDLVPSEATSPHFEEKSNDAAVDEQGGSAQSPDTRTAAALAAAHGVSRATVERAGAFAEAVERLGLVAEVTKGERMPWSRQEVTSAAKALPEDAAPVAIAKVVEKLKKQGLAKQARQATNSSASNEWYTPAQYIDAAREVMGVIDLDPASCKEANQTVRAKRFYTERDDGLSKPWRGRVWCNPPYGRGERNVSNQDLWSTALIERYAAGEVAEGCMLVNSRTGDLWFQKLWNWPICFIAGRINFVSNTGFTDAPIQSSVIVYVGPNQARFREVFRRFGRVVMPEDVALQAVVEAA